MATTSRAERPVRALYRRLLEAWNERDAETYGALFAVDGLMIGFDGSQASGSAVADHLRPIFKDHPTASYVAKVLAIREVGSGAAVLHAMVGMVPPDQDRLNPETNALQTLVAEEHEDDWRIVLFQNTPAQHHGRPELVEQHTAELQAQLDSGTRVG